MAKIFLISMVNSNCLWPQEREANVLVESKFHYIILNEIFHLQKPMMSFIFHQNHYCQANCRHFSACQKCLVEK